MNNRQIVQLEAIHFPWTFATCDKIVLACHHSIRVPFESPTSSIAMHVVTRCLQSFRNSFDLDISIAEQHK